MKKIVYAILMQLFTLTCFASSISCPSESAVKIGEESFIEAREIINNAPFDSKKNEYMAFYESDTPQKVYSSLQKSALTGNINSIATLCLSQSDKAGPPFARMQGYAWCVLLANISSKNKISVPKISLLRQAVEEVKSNSNKAEVERIVGLAAFLSSRIPKCRQNNDTVAGLIGDSEPYYPVDKKILPFMHIALFLQLKKFVIQ